MIRTKRQKASEATIRRKFPPSPPVHTNLVFQVEPWALHWQFTCLHFFIVSISLIPLDFSLDQWFWPFYFIHTNRFLNVKHVSFHLKGFFLTLSISEHSRSHDLAPFFWHYIPGYHIQGGLSHSSFSTLSQPQLQDVNYYWARSTL